MKRIIYFLIFVLLIAACQRKQVPVKSRYVPVNVGSAPNDGTGDNLRAAFQKVNAGFVDVYDSLANIYRKTQTETLMNDSLLQLRLDAEELNDLSPLWSDTLPGGRIPTRSDLLNVSGGGGTAGKFYILSGNVDDTGFPEDGDTSLTHTNFIGKHLNVFREGQLQQQHADNTVQDGFWLNNATGEIRFRPALIAGEQIEIWSTNTIQWQSLVAEGGGAESTLLTGLRAYWQLDEVSGTAVYDVFSVYNGTTNASVNQAGKHGVAEVFNGSQFVDLGQTVGDVGTNDFTLAAWVKLTSWPPAGNTSGAAGNWGTYPYYYIGVFQGQSKILGTVNFTGSNILLYSDAVISLDTWYHVALVADRSGNATLYVDGVAQADVEDISAHSAVSLVNNNTFAIGRVGSTLTGFNWTGTVDEVGLWLKALTVDEVNELMDETYPF